VVAQVGLEDLAELASGQASASVPDDVREVGRRVFTDILASYLAVAPGIEARVAPPRTIVNGAAATASRIASAAHALDFDETHFGSSVHAGSAVVGVLLGLAEAGTEIDGAELHATIAVALEVSARIGLGAPRVAQRRGYTTTSVYAPLAAAAAAVRAMGLDAGFARHALALATEGAGGTRGGHLDAGADTKCLHMGRAAAWGLISAALAAGGATGAPDPLFGRYGLYSTTLGLRPDEVDRTAVFGELGERWVVREIGFKRFPTHLGVQACAEALLSLRERPDPARVERVTCFVHPAVVATVGEPREVKIRPPNAYSARFSLPIVAAMCLLDGRLDARSFSERSVRRAELQDLAARVEVIGDPEAPEVSTYPGRVGVRYSGGEVRWTRWRDAPGVPSQPLSMAELEGKFHTYVAPRSGAQAVKLVLKELRGPCRIRKLLALVEELRADVDDGKGSASSPRTPCQDPGV
jgi:2-methylcitrate dehydratase PrpD